MTLCSVLLVCVNIRLPASFFKVRTVRDTHTRGGCACVFICVCAQYPVVLLLCWFRLPLGQHVILILQTHPNMFSVFLSLHLSPFRVLYWSITNYLFFFFCFSHALIYMKIKAIGNIRTEYNGLHGLNYWMFVFIHNLCWIFIVYNWYYRKVARNIVLYKIIGKKCAKCVNFCTTQSKSEIQML